MFQTPAVIQIAQYDMGVWCNWVWHMLGILPVRTGGARCLNCFDTFGLKSDAKETTVQGTDMQLVGVSCANCGNVVCHMHFWRCKNIRIKYWSVQMTKI